MYVKKIGDVIVAAARAPLGDTNEQVDEGDAGLLAFLATPPASLPIQVSAAQLIKALAELNLLAGVDAAVAQADPLTQRLWARASMFPRNDPLVIAAAGALGKTSEELDTIFALAATK